MFNKKLSENSHGASKTYLLTTLISIFILTIFLVVNKNSLVIGLDSFVNNFFINHQSQLISKIMLSVTKICNPYEAFIIFIIFGIFLAIKHIKYFYAFTIATFLGSILPIIIKYMTTRTRPSNLIEQDYSFPSGHATVATIFLLSSIIFLAPYIKKAFSRNLFIVITSIIFPLVAFSRIYIGAHWTSDVMAGIVLGAICFASSDLLSCYKKENVL